MTDRKDQVYRCTWNQLHRALGQGNHPNAQQAEDSFKEIEKQGGKPVIFLQLEHFIVVDARPASGDDWRTYLSLSDGAKDCNTW